MKPENELGVIVLFAQQAEAAGFEILSIRSQFPDAIVKHQGKEYRAEFEYQAATFKEHKHDIRQCDLIIAWENDWPECILPILALSEPAWANTPLELPGQLERKAAYWELRARMAENQLKKTKDKIISTGTPGTNDEKILKLLTLNPQLTHAEIGTAIGVTRQAVGQRLKKLEAEGLVKRNGRGVEVQ